MPPALGEGYGVCGESGVMWGRSAFQNNSRRVRSPILITKSLASRPTFPSLNADTANLARVVFLSTRLVAKGAAGKYFVTRGMTWFKVRGVS